MFGIARDRIPAPLALIQLDNEDVDSEQKADRQNANE